MPKLIKKPIKTETSKAVEQIESASEVTPEASKNSSWADPDYLVPSGSTLLNCALSDDPFGGYLLGTFVNTIGDSGTGKTLLALSALAEMATIQRFDDYRFIFDDIEAALAKNIKKMFGSKVANRIEGPNTKSLSKSSNTIQDYYANLLKAIKDGRPFIYITDSLDALTSKEEQKRANAVLTKKVKSEGEGESKDKGSYKMEKAKLLSEILRVTAREIAHKEAFVNIISQTRDNIGWGFTDKTRSGGRALKFYCYHEMWISSVGQIPKLDEKIGSNSRVQVSKNKLTFKKKTVDMPIYDNYGIDDIGSCIDFLVARKVWTKVTKHKIGAAHFDWEGTRSTIIARIERANAENELRKIVGEAWKEKENALDLGRKQRYE